MTDYPEAHLLYGNDFWSVQLGTELQKAPLNDRIHLIFSLIIFLGVTLASFLEFCFASPIREVRNRVGMFMAHTPSASSPDKIFPPSMVYRLWHEKWPKAIPELHRTVQECALEIAVEESNRLIEEKSLKVVVKSLTIAKIRELLDPSKIAATFERLAPFTWNYLCTFASAPNEYRRRKKKQEAKNGPQESSAETMPILEDFDDWNGDEDPDFDLGKKAGFMRNPLYAVVLAISMLIFVRNRATNILPLILGLFFKISGTSSRVIHMLSNAGICVSETTVERLKKRISDDAVDLAIAFVASGRLFYFLYDNINIYLRKFQQRITNRNSMIHATNTAIIGVDEEGIDVEQARDLKSKLNLRGKRAKAKFEDIVPTKDDGDNITLAFQGHIAQLIIRYCPGNKSWEGRSAMLAEAIKLVPEERPLPPKKTEFFPLGVFDVNEGSKKGIIKLFDKVHQKLKLAAEVWSSSIRYFLGDWLSSANFRGARRDRIDDIDSKERLEYGEELSTLWHFALQASHMIMRTHYGTVMDPASLASHKGLLGRTWDVNKPNYAAAKALIRHSMIARLLHLVMVYKKFKRWSELKSWKPSSEEIQEISVWIQVTYTTVTAAEAAKDAKDDWIAHTIYFLRDALLFMEFEEAVSCADAGRVLRILKYWTLAFRGVGQHNYSRECAEVLIRWEYETTEDIRKTLERAWFVNRWGLERRFIASDLYMEQLNFWVKRVFIAEGNGATIDYLASKGSACVEAFRDVSHRVSNFFGDADRSRRSKEIKFEEDLRRLVEEMVKKNLHDTSNPQEHFVPAPSKKSRNGRSLPPQSSIIDVQVIGAGAWAQGKFLEFVKSTTYDPAVGYPIEVIDENASVDDTTLDTGTPFDFTRTNPLVVDTFEDVHGDENDENGALGGGGEYGPEETQV